MVLINFKTYDLLYDVSFNDTSSMLRIILKTDETFDTE